MNMLVWLAVGAIIGWVASLLMSSDGREGLLLNVIVGVVGATVGGLLVAPMLGIPTLMQGSLSVASLIVSLVGAIALLALFNLLRERRVR